MINSSMVTKNGEEEGRGGAPGIRAEIPLWPVEKAVVVQVVPQKPVEDLREADLHPEVHAFHSGCIRWACCEEAAAWGEPSQSRFLAGAVADGMLMLEQYSLKD